MELILPAFVTLVTVFVRWAIKQFGKELGTAFTLILAFLLSGVVALIYTQTDKIFWERLLEIFSVQLAMYKVVYQLIITPVLNKLFPNL
jgi:uncharacterized membrane-anchored protein YitT (DUF2179 family)